MHEGNSPLQQSSEKEMHVVYKAILKVVSMKVLR